MTPCYPPAVHRVTILAVAVVLATVLAACSEASSSSAPPERSLAVETLTPLEPAESFPTEPPLEPPIDTPAPDESFPTEPPLDTPAPPEESLPPEGSFPPEPSLVTPPPGGSQPVTACSDSTDEQNFYAAVVAKVSWAVYCPGLPAGWRIVTGHRETGRVSFLEISYTNRSGARLELREGMFCSQADGCVPAGSDAGAASFGDMAGTLVAGSDGSLAIVVDRGADVSWLLVGRSIDEATFRDLAANMIRVEP